MIPGKCLAGCMRSEGCPCPGIGDVALGLSDTILHFGYNVLAYAGIAVAYAAHATGAGGLSIWPA